MNTNGEWEKLTPRKTFWSMYYLNSFPIGDQVFERKFRTRFRIPFYYFKELLSDVKTNPLFKRWQHRKVDTPIVFGLLLLGTLRYLGRGWTFDDLEESTAISQYVHRDFFHVFIQYGKEYLYPKHVIFPSSSADVAMYCRAYEKAGFHGAIGSMDACHTVIEKCSHRLKQNYLGGKSKLTCRSFNSTCNHRRQILHTTGGHPARWNDKTIILYDKIAVGLRTGELLNDNTFELFDRDTNGNVIKLSIEELGYLWIMAI